MSRNLPIRLLLLLVLSLAVGCASHRQPPPFEIHSALTTSGHFFGSPLSGPVTGNVSKVDLNDALDVRVDWFSLETFTAFKMPLVASQATLVTARLASQAVLSSTSLTSNARIAWFNDAPNTRQLVLESNRSRIDPIGQARSALPDGITALFRAVETGGEADQTLAHPEPRYIELSVYRRSADQLQFALALHEPQPSELNYTPGVFQREVALIEHAPTKPQTAALLVIPFVFIGPPNQAVAAVVTVTAPNNDPTFQSAVAQCKKDLQSPQSAEISPLWTLGLQRAMSELDDPRYTRAAVVYLASQGDAQLCQDVAMLADDAMLKQIVADIKRDVPAAIAAGNLEQYSWILDRSAIHAMQPLLTKANLPPELFAVLTQHFGEPGRHAAAVDEVMRGVSSRAELHTRLVAENFIYLEDSSPASRVRAYQWLSAQKLAPAGYDPLASPKQRRQALDQALSGAAQ